MKACDKAELLCRGGRGRATGEVPAWGSRYEDAGPGHSCSIAPRARLAGGWLRSLTASPSAKLGPPLPPPPGRRSSVLQQAASGELMQQPLLCPGAAGVARDRGRAARRRGWHVLAKRRSQLGGLFM